MMLSQKLRRKFQVASLIMHNGYLGFLFGIPLYRGFLKGFLAPGLNCHSCPASLFACPIGMLQNSLATYRTFSLQNFLPTFTYTLGFLIFWGVLLSRFICGWLCPFGLIQELLYKIPSPKKRLSPAPGIRIFIKGSILLVSVIIVPVFIVKGFYGINAFCKYLCPAGTLEAAIPQIILQPRLRHFVGALFFLKLFILLVIIIFCILEERFFCKTLCPLGLVYGLFNKISILNFPTKENKCKICEASSLECIKCLKCIK